MRVASIRPVSGHGLSMRRRWQDEIREPQSREAAEAGLCGTGYSRAPLVNWTGIELLQRDSGTRLPS